VARGQYIRVYHSLKDEYPATWNSPAQLGLYVQLLMVADKWWPQLAPVPRRNGAYQSLVKSGLVLEKRENGATIGYTILGLDKERSGRSEHARHAVRTRWEYSENTQPIPSKAEQSRTEHSNGHSPSTFMSFPPKKVAAVPSPVDLADIERQQRESLEDAIRKTREREAGK